MIDIDEKLNVSELLSVYGALLTEHQAEMMRLYYDCDISLFEISTEFNISRQAVRDAIQRGVKTLKEVDSKLNIKSKLDTFSKELDHIITEVKDGDKDKAIEMLKSLKSAMED